MRSSCSVFGATRHEHFRDQGVWPRGATLAALVLVGTVRRSRVTRVPSPNAKARECEGEQCKRPGFGGAQKLDLVNVGRSWKSTFTTRQGPGYEYLAYTGSRQSEGTNLCA